MCEGRGLPKNTIVSNCDVVCGDRVIGTTPLQQSRNPIWGDTYSLYVRCQKPNLLVSDVLPKEQLVVVNVWIETGKKGRKFLGSVALEIEEMEDGKVVEAWYIPSRKGKQRDCSVRINSKYSVRVAGLYMFNFLGNRGFNRRILRSNRGPVVGRKRAYFPTYFFVHRQLRP